MKKAILAIVCLCALSPAGTKPAMNKEFMSAGLEATDSLKALESKFDRPSTVYEPLDTEASKLIEKARRLAKTDAEREGSQGLQSWRSVIGVARLHHLWQETSSEFAARMLAARCGLEATVIFDPNPQITDAGRKMASEKRCVPDTRTMLETAAKH